ncbi:metallophosphoesterase [Sulfurospirillum arcachonense]|uniref:metallophosphoesterase n=1 Tax=Sulfurospirillum arcachonense TaxID=57666 RepID=UPI00046AA4C0|nr:metallophosphoesterase [Sulfurospirillum arcachonense]
MHIVEPTVLEVFVENTSLNNLRILHLSDLHINKKTNSEVLKLLVKQCNDLEVDFIALTGDIIDCKVKFIKEKLQILNSISKSVYYISGNHDLFYGLSSLQKVLSNFIFLDNQIKTIEFKGNSINIIGLSDRFSKFFGHKRDEKKIKNILKKSSPSIFLAHQPKDYKIAVNSQTELFLCGHTHGGQIFPFHYLVRLVQPFLNGLFYVNKTAIYVNKGLGTWGIDYRYKAKAEMTILKLISKKVQ